MGAHRLRSYIDGAPRGFREVPQPAALVAALVAAGASSEDCAAYQRADGLRVIVSIEELDDGCGVWLHASLSFTSSLPRWRDVKEVHQAFLGDRPAVQLLAPRSHWVNVHEYTLHLFTRLDGDTVPPQMWGGE